MTNQKPSTFPKASDPKYWGWDIDTGPVFKEADYQADIKVVRETQKRHHVEPTGADGSRVN